MEIHLVVAVCCAGCATGAVACCTFAAVLVCAGVVVATDAVLAVVAAACCAAGACATSLFATLAAGTRLTAVATADKSAVTAIGASSSTLSDEIHWSPPKLYQVSPLTVLTFLYVFQLDYQAYLSVSPESLTDDRRDSVKLIYFLFFFSRLSR